MRFVPVGDDPQAVPLNQSRIPGGRATRPLSMVVHGGLPRQIHYESDKMFLFGAE